MTRSFYCDLIADFLQSSTEQILGVLAQNNEFSLEITQKAGWIQETISF